MDWFGPTGFTKQGDMVLLAPTRLKERQVEVIAPMVTRGPNVGPPDAKVGRPKNNMIIVDAKSSSHKSIMAFLHCVCRHGLLRNLLDDLFVVVSDRKQKPTLNITSCTRRQNKLNVALIAFNLPF